MKLNLFICEDDERQSQLLEHYILDYLQNRGDNQNVEMVLRLTATSPNEMLKVASESDVPGIYFLDIDLGSEINGLELAAKIRKLDPKGEIIFITTHEDMMPLTFEYKLKALGYIVKDDFAKIESKINEYLNLIDSQFYEMQMVPEKPIFNFFTVEKTISEPYENILFFEKVKGRNKLKMHTKTAVREFVGTIKEIEKVDDCLQRCDNGTVVNIRNIVEFNIKTRVIEMTGGIQCHASFRLAKNLKQTIEAKIT